MFGVEQGAVAHHRVEDVASAAGEGEQRVLMALALSAFAVVVRARGRIAQRSERREMERPFQAPVATPRSMLAADRCPRSPRDRCQTGTRGEMSGRSEARPETSTSTRAMVLNPIPGIEFRISKRGCDSTSSST